MLCDFCGNKEAIMFIEQVDDDGIKSRINICDECAQKKGILPESKNIASNILNVFKEINSNPSNSKIVNSEKPVNIVKKCPVCSMSLKNLKLFGKLGCPECYEYFKDDVEKFIEKSGFVKSFQGSIPARISIKKTSLMEKINLQKKLEDALSQEDYERAAILRDQIRAIENNSEEIIQKTNEEVL